MCSHAMCSVVRFACDRNPWLAHDDHCGGALLNTPSQNLLET